jgi:hypothetical protein
MLLCHCQPGQPRKVPPPQTPIPPPRLGPPCILSPLWGVLLVMVVRPLCSNCCIVLQSNLIVVLVLLPPTHIVFCHCDTVQVVSPPIWQCLLWLFDQSGPLRPTKVCTAINPHHPWKVWINPSLPPPPPTMANDFALLPIPSPSSHASVSCPGVAIAGLSTSMVLSGTSSTH